MDVLRNVARIAEIFVSIQGEGAAVGIPTLFIRFAGCNLDCTYCDTRTEHYRHYTPAAFVKKVSRFCNDTYLMISLTGGEPLLQVDFLEKVLPYLKAKQKPLYLQTNGTLPGSLKRIARYLDTIAADMKVQYFHHIYFSETHERFLQTAGRKLSIKIVITPEITAAQIRKAIALLKKTRYTREVILQPETTQLARSFAKASALIPEFIKKHLRVRIVPQVHTFLKIR